MEKQYNITATDAANVVRIIDIVSERGAFKGVELSSVGLIRDLFMKIVDDHNKDKNQSEQSATPATQ